MCVCAWLWSVPVGPERYPIRWLDFITVLPAGIRAIERTNVSKHDNGNWAVFIVSSESARRLFLLYWVVPAAKRPTSSSSHSLPVFSFHCGLQLCPFLKLLCLNRFSPAKTAHCCLFMISSSIGMMKYYPPTPFSLLRNSDGECRSPPKSWENWKFRYGQII